jgi:hypothetical protein
MTVESIQKSSVLTPYQKVVETKLLLSAFDREQQEDMFRLLFKFVDKVKSINHWVGDAYLDSLVRDAENEFLND